LWIGFPSVGAILDAATLDRVSNLPDLEVELTRRERQVLSVLHRSSYALRHGQLAALVWSDPDRTHDVRSALYRLRRKLRNSGWAIPFPVKGNGVRLVPDPTSNRQPKSAGQQPDQGSEAILHKAA
jgi:DNA-binding winged helix-turn-helix (wHTH) protein